MEDREDKINQILQMLLTEESVETNMIEIYKSLLDLGAENCVDEKEKEEFRNGINILYEDSVRHKEAILRIRNKYSK